MTATLYSDVDSADNKRRPIDLSALLVRPLRISDEGQQGYRLRLAHANGIMAYSWMCRVDRMVSTRSDIEHARWCPHCLIEGNAYWHKSWGTGVSICLRHQCWLLDTCTCCQRMATWRSVNFLECSCGTPLVTMAATPLSAHMTAIFEERHTDDPTTTWWAVMSTVRKWKVVRFLGALYTYGLHGKPFKKASISELTNERRILEAGAEILLDGEAGFCRLLQRIRAPARSGTNVQLMREAFPGLLLRMRKLLLRDECEEFIPQIQAYLAKSAIGEVPISWRSKGSVATVGATECARVLGMSSARIKDILTSHGLTPKVRQTVTGRSMLAIAAADLKTLQEASSNLMSQRVAQQAFGLSASRQGSLVQAGLIQMIERKVDARSIRKLFADLALRDAGTSGNAELTFVRLDVALRTLVPQPLNVPFFRAILDGCIAIRSLAENCVHTSHFEISIQDARAVLESVRDASDKPLSIPEVAIRLHLKEEVVYHLVNRGLIKTLVRREGRRPSRFISESKLLRFQGRYEPLTNAAARAGIYRQGGLKWAIENGIKIVSGPSVDGGRQYFVEKV